jgi:formamidopyrimidine-DNA glycosylase
MPELPDVEVYRRHLDATCRGRRIAGVRVNSAKVLAGVTASGLAALLKGARIGAARRHGKQLLVDLGAVGWLALHFGMNGSLKHFKDVADDPAYDRVRFDFADGHHLAYINPRQIGRITLTDDADQFVTRERLGPDALDRRLGLVAFQKAVGGRRRDIKSILMDQTVIAGIGNIYSDEILFQAQLHPRTRADRVDPLAMKRLYRAVKKVLKTAVARGAGAELRPERHPASFLLRQRRRGGLCPRCRGKIATIKFSGRTAYFCPRCQKRAGGGRAASTIMPNMR